MVGTMKRRSVKDVLENPRKEHEYYVLVTREYPKLFRFRGLKLVETPIDVWDRDLAPSWELLKDYKRKVLTVGKTKAWEEYTGRFLQEVPLTLIKRKAKLYQEQAGEKEVVFVCSEEDWEYPHCHTWIILDVLKSNPTVFVEVRFLKDTPMITGVDMKQYGPFRKGDVAALPKENARVLIKMKVAEKRVKPPKEPTLKEVMKGEVLTGYVEAARVVRVLGEEVLLSGPDTVRLADLFLDLLTDAGVSLPSRFKGEFEEAMDIYKPYDENVELIEEAAHRIILRETGKEYPVGEPLRKAREKVEKLLTEIREAIGE